MSAFICNSLSCTIALSKATFPVQMSCPVCQQALFELHTDPQFLPEDELLINNLPYVIAFPFKRAILEQHAWTKINLLKDTFLNYLKYLGLVTASEFFQSPFKDKRMVALFHSTLAEPSFGSWNQYIRETIAFLQQNNHSFFCPELPLYYETIETGKKRKLYKGEIQFIDSNGDIQLKKQEATAIGMLINFRNRYLGHGLTLDAATAQQLWNEYFPCFKDLLMQMTFSKSYPMFKTEHGETYRLQSDKLQPCENPNAKQSHVWMENSAGNIMDIIPFFVVPGEIAIAKEDKEQILTYESYTGKTIKFFSPEGTEKQTSGKILERLNMLLRDKQKEQPFTPDVFTKEVFLVRVAEENKLILETLITEKKLIPGVYVRREEMEIKLREWIGARANIFVLAAEAGSGKTNLLVEIQKQYAERGLPSLLIRAGRMEKTTIHAQLCYLLNIDEQENLNQYTAIAGNQEEPTFVLIDGLNEAHESEKLWSELFEISKQFESGSLKFVVTSRANSADEINRYALSEEQEGFLYGDAKDKEMQVSAYTHWLTALSMEDMKQAWGYYVQKDKSKFKPLFAFDDLADFDRALYNQINNPLVLRLFLETYHGKNLPKKGKSHLDIWSDWLSSFSQTEQEFFTALANAIWNKGENELLIDDVLKNENLKQYFTTDQLNAPYPRLRNLGWVSRYVKDLNSCVGFTVEGALFYLLGKIIENQKPHITHKEIKQLLQTGCKIKQAGVVAYLQHLALKGDLNIVCELIDAGEGFIDFCVIPIVLHLKTIGVKETLDILLQNPTENDWKALLKVDATLKELTLNVMRKELAIESLSRNDFSYKSGIQLGIQGIALVDREEGEYYLSKINLNTFKEMDDAEICSNCGDLFKHFGEYDKALGFYQKCLDIQIKNLGDHHPGVAITYDNIGNVFHYKGDFNKALSFYEVCLDIRLKTHASHDYLVAESFNNIGVAWSDKGEYDKALEFYQKCLNIQLITLGNRHPSVAICYTHIGLVWKLNGEYDKALEFYQKALDIELKTLGNQHPDVATSYSNIGVAWGKKGEYDKALEFYQKALDIQLKTLGNQHPYVATSYSNIGVAWGNKGENDKALEFYQKTLDLQLKIFGNKHPDLATSYSNIGVAWSDKGEYDKALEFYQKALDLQLKIFGNQHPDLAISYSNIGVAWGNKGENDKALEFYQKALDLRLKIFGNQHPDVAISYSNIGVVWDRKGENDKALEFYQKALDLRLKIFGNQHPDVATSYSNIGVALGKKGENDKALEFYHKSLELQLKILGSQHPSIATSYNNIGWVWDKKSEYEKALEFYHKSLELHLKILGSQHPSVATSYNNIGWVWAKKGEYEKALDFYQQCLDIELKNLGNQHPDVATSYNNIGVAWDRKGEYEKALEFYQKALDLQLKIFGNQHPDVATSYFRIGDCQKELQMYQEAIQSFKSGFEIQKKGGFAFKLAQCYEALKDNEAAFNYFLQSAEIRKDDPEAGPEVENTKESIENTVRLSKLLNKENLLPKWIKKYL